MMKNTIFLILIVIFGFYACEDDNSIFDLSTDGLEIKFTPVAGGAMMHYSLPKNREIFAMNIRYKDWQGQDVLKTCGYSGDSVLLDGFTRKQEGVNAQISFVNHRNEESVPFDYSFSTDDSAPWTFFDNLEVIPSWNGFQISYQSPSVVTGMVHVFYMGTNPLTQQEDTILLSSFPITQRGDTIHFIQKQERTKNTVIIRTEDFQGFRVRQEIYADIDAFRTEKWPMAVENFNDFGMSVKNNRAKTGPQYLFDGETKGEERMIASAFVDPTSRNGTEVYATYLAGPHAYEKPFVLDLREEKTPAWVRLYCLYPLTAKHPAGSSIALGTVWNGSYEDKIPCSLSVYGSNGSSDPKSEDWVFLGRLNQKPEREVVRDRWSFLTTQIDRAPKDLIELAAVEPVYVDVQLPPINNTYRYLKVIVHDTFDTSREGGINFNQNEYFTLHELEVYVKKN